MKKLRLITVLFCSIFFLTACGSDVDLVMDFVNDWMVEQGMMYKDSEGNYKPTLKAAGVATGWSTSGDPRIDAAVQAGSMLKDIKESDDLIDDAQKLMDMDPPDVGTALGKMDAAVANRPNDWYYRNSRGMLFLQTGNLKAADDDFEKGLGICGSNSRCREALYRDRASQLEEFKAAKTTPMNCAENQLLRDSYGALTLHGSDQDKQASFLDLRQINADMIDCPRN